MCQALLAHSWHFEKVSFRSAGVPNAHSPLASAQALHQTGGHHLKVSCVQRVTALPPTFQDPTHHRPIPLILDWLQLSPPVSDKDEVTWCVWSRTGMASKTTKSLNLSTSWSRTLTTGVFSTLSHGRSTSQSEHLSIFALTQDTVA